MESRTRPPSSSDRDLVVAFKSGDERAYDEIYRRHSPKVRAVCSRRLGHPFDADEAVQETFVRAYQALGRFNGQYKLAAWLNRIAVNVCIDELRNRARSEIVEDIGDHAIDIELGPDEILGSRRPEVIEALNELKPIHADVLRLRAFGELSHEELAAHLQITPAQVKSLLHRARLAFKRVVREASGFIAFPLAALRRNKKADHLAATAGSANAMGLVNSLHLSLPVAERIVTGVVVAALAIGGSSPIDMPENDLRAAQRVHASDMHRKVEPESSISLDRRGPVHDERRVTNTVTAEVPLDVANVTSLPDPVTEQVKRELDEHTMDTDPKPDIEQPKDVERLTRSAAERAENVADATSETPAALLGDS